ncbi:hypothetical protein E2I00_017113, partial [Balaenoptera physalus]
SSLSVPNPGEDPGVLSSPRPPILQPPASCCHAEGRRPRIPGVRGPKQAEGNGTSVCCLVLVALSLWPGRAAAPGPPPGPPRASPDPRAELDSAVLLTRSLLADTRQLAAQLRDKFPADGDHNLDSLPTLAMSAGALGALQWLRRAGGPSLRTLEPDLGALQARLDRLLRRLQL